MDTLLSESENGDEKIKGELINYIDEHILQTLHGHGEIKIDRECYPNVNEDKHERSTASTVCMKSSSDAEVQDVSENDVTKPVVTIKTTDAISPKDAAAVVRHGKASRLPNSPVRKLHNTETKECKIGLKRRKSRDIRRSDIVNFLATSSIPADNPASPRFPKVSSPHPLGSGVRRAGLITGGSPERPLYTVYTSLPPIRPPGGADSGGAGRQRSRIPVRTRSADCRTGRQAARRSARSGSCGSDSGRQAARRSGKRLVRSSSCGSDNGHQAAPRSTRSNSCGSTSGRRKETNRAPVASSRSLIDVNDNARLVSTNGRSICYMWRRDGSWGWTCPAFSFHWPNGKRHQNVSGYVCSLVTEGWFNVYVQSWAKISGTTRNFKAAST